jgi:hypothetical protein
MLAGPKKLEQDGLIAYIAQNFGDTVSLITLQMLI